MRHITLTGIYAGQTVCGCERNDTDTFSHLGSWVDNPELQKEICPKCLEIYNSLDDEE
jgi:hypothetical protein